MSKIKWNSLLRFTFLEIYNVIAQSSKRNGHKSHVVVKSHAASSVFLPGCIHCNGGRLGSWQLCCCGAREISSGEAAKAIRKLGRGSRMLRSNFRALRDNRTTRYAG